MSQWEYRVLTVNTLHSEPTAMEFLTADDLGGDRIKKLLNSMGDQGWELVAFVPAQPAGYMWKHPASGAESWVDANPWIYHAIFKKSDE
jgi:hypothetical protein